MSRKDQFNKIKISPLTNHRNTKKGVIKGGFDRTALFENVEKGFIWQKEIVFSDEKKNIISADTQPNKLAHKPSDMQISSESDKIENEFANIQNSDKYYLRSRWNGGFLEENML